MANKSFKPLAVLARTLGTPHLIAHGFAIVAQTVLRTERRLTGYKGFPPNRKHPITINGVRVIDFAIRGFEAIPVFRI
ncbi:hypothetical protein [Nitrogeniibacter aestuarii]|uniref:hypothetical protein n=1 Tax=Nitrogeniibacter aestuarii TaxID=2815343 RepID=UPI001D10E090|nr:hypothetical protein [Nitrogeniibacter aestuarii]